MARRAFIELGLIGGLLSGLGLSGFTVEVSGPTWRTDYSQRKREHTETEALSWAKAATPVWIQDPAMTDVHRSGIP